MHTWHAKKKRDSEEPNIKFIELEETMLEANETSTAPSSNFCYKRCEFRGKNLNHSKQWNLNMKKKLRESSRVFYRSPVVLTQTIEMRISIEMQISN